MQEYGREHIQVTLVKLSNNGTTISAVYCLSKYNIRKEQFTEYFRTFWPIFISVGDRNTKNTF